MAVVLRFVDSTEADRSTRLDLNTDVAVGLRNLVVNPSFETDATGWTGVNATLSRVVGASAFGAAYLRVEATTSAAGPRAESADNTFDVAAAPGEVVTLSGYCKREVGSRDARPVLQWEDAAGTVIGTETGATKSPTSTDWSTRISVTSTAPASTARARLRLDMANAGAVGDRLGFDGVLVQKSSTAGEYGDGDSDGWIWDGTPHASTSRSRAIELDDVDANGQPDFGTAAIERTLADVEGRDGAVVTSSKRPMREVRLPLLVHGTSADNTATLGTIARECDRRINYLEWTPDDATVDPVFFVVHQGDIEPPNYQYDAADRWACELVLLCDPTALGALESGSATVTVDPAAANSPMFALPAVKGDVPAPLSLSVSAADMSTSGEAFVSVASGSSSFSAPFFVQAESMTLGTDTTAGANAVTTFDTDDSMVLRLSGSVAAVPPGRWRVWGRFQTATAGAAFNLRMNVGTTGNAVGGEEVVFDVDPSSDWYWVDLGAFDHPYYQPPDHTAAEEFRLRFFAERTSGAGADLSTDVFLLTPHDLRGNNEGAACRFLPVAAIIGSWRLNPEWEKAYPTSPSRAASISGSHEFRAVPGETTYVHVLPATSPATNDGSLDGATVDWEYAPRYLFVAAP